MKKQDVVLIVVVAFVSAVFSLAISSVLFSGKHHQQQAEVVQPITADFPQPDSRFFNRNAFDPTQQITISPNLNPDPFSGSSQ